MAMASFAPSRHERLALGLGLALLFLCLLPFAGSSIYNNDEFTYMSHARRIAAGQVPYRDFFEFIPPLPLWLHAAANHAGAPSLATTHALAALLIGIAGVQLYFLARRLGVGPWLAWLPGFTLLFGGYTHWAIYSHHWLVLPFELAALQLAMRGLTHPGWQPWALAGLGVGFAGLSMQTDGAALGLLLAAGVMIDGWQRREPVKLVVMRLAALTAGTAVPVLAAAGILAAQGALGAAFEDVVRWPLTQYRHPGGMNDVDVLTDLPTRLQPITARPVWYFRVYHLLGLYALVLAAFVGAAAWGLAWIGRRLRGEGWTAEQGALGLVGLWAIASLLVCMRGNGDHVHVTCYAVPAFLWCTVGAARLARLPGLPGTELLRWLPALAVVGYMATGALGQAKAMVQDPGLWNRPLHPDFRLENSEIVRFLKAHMRPGDRMAAMPYAGFFHVYGPPPATPYTFILTPEEGYGTHDQFDAFWAEVAKARPRFIVVAPWAWDTWERTLRQYTDHLPPRYHLVGSFQNPQYGNTFPAVVYMADEAP